MAITDYASLKAAVATRAIRADLTALIPDFVRDAHDEIVGDFSISTTLTLSAATASLPSDFRDVVALFVETYPATPLTRGDASQVANLGSGVPTCFSVSGTTLTVAPTPDATYTARLLYKVSRTPFSADADTNAILTRYPRLYRDGSMAELFAHARNGDEEAKYRQKFEGGLEQAQSIELEAMYAGLTLQPRPSMVV